MMMLHIKAWNYSAGHTEGEPLPNNDKIYDMLLQSQDEVAKIEQSFQQLTRGVQGTSAMVNGYRYQFTFFHDKADSETYLGATCNSVWSLYKDGKRVTEVSSPDAILNSLHESIGLPVRSYSPPPQPLQPLTAPEVLARLEEYTVKH